MGFSIDFQDILVFCIAQMLVLIFILSQKKYRVLPNLFLGMIFVLLIIHFVHYLLIHNGVLINSPILATVLKYISFFPPVLIFIYTNLVITGYMIFSGKEILLMFSGFFIAVLLFIVLLSAGNIQYLPVYNFVLRELILLNYIVFAFLIFRTLAKFCGTGSGIFRSVFRFSNPRFNWLKILAVVLTVDIVMLFIDINFSWLIPFHEGWHDRAMAVFLIVLSYIFLYGLINYPEVIHIDHKQIGLSSTRKYARPNLSKKESKELMEKMNSYMEKNKPWLNPEFCMADFSEQLAVSGHLISEVTNGVMKQNFFDYVNNYRIEEFKRLVQNPEKKNDKIQFLAYDAGFNSKTTFNTAFKKFTGKTPSEYRQMISRKESMNI